MRGPYCDARAVSATDCQGFRLAFWLESSSSVTAPAPAPTAAPAIGAPTASPAAPPIRPPLAARSSVLSPQAARISPASTTKLVMMRTALSIPRAALTAKTINAGPELPLLRLPWTVAPLLTLGKKMPRDLASNVERLPPTNVYRKEFNRRASKMYRIAITVAALGLTACAATSPYGAPSGTSVSAQDVNCGAGVLGGALLGGLAGNQVGKGQGQDLATAAGATIGGLFGATRPECQPQAYGQGYGRYPQGYVEPYGRYPQTAVLVGYDRHGRPVYR